MKILPVLFFLFLVTLSKADSPDQSITFFTDSDYFLEKHVSNGQVNYKAIAKNPEDLKKLIVRVEEMELTGKSAEEKMAFYINGYNLLVIKSVIRNFPMKSPLDIDGFFDKTKHKVAGEMLTLNEIENQRLRTPYQDARIHFALVCAAKGCPSLLNKAYLPANMDVQLTIRTKEALEQVKNLVVKPDEKKVLVSEIFKWYKEDFQPSTLAFLNKFLENKIPLDYSIDYVPYDWELNAQ